MTRLETAVTNSGPMCPMSVGRWKNDAHRMMQDTLNTFYLHVLQDSSGELLEDARIVYDGAVQGELNENMKLFTHHEQFVVGRPGMQLDTYWWQCTVCGFVLPVTQVTDFVRGSR